MNVNAHIVRRDDGKDYAIINDMSLDFIISEIKMEFKYPNIASPITNMVDGVVNSNWKILKSMLDPTLKRFLCGMIKAVITPMFNEIPLQCFFNMN